MARIAVIGPETLLGKELCERLGETSVEIKLLTETPPQDGTAVLSSYGGSAALVHEATAENLSNVELIFVCRDGENSSELPFEESATVIHLGPGPYTGKPAVAGVQAEQPARGEQIYSPAAGVILAAHLLSALRDLGPVSGSAVVVEPVSTLGNDGIDELMTQTRAMLAFAPQPTERLGTQLAFTLQEGSASPSRSQLELQELLPNAPRFSVLTLRAGVFHGTSAAVHLELTPDHSHSELIDALESSPYIEWREDGGLSQKDVAGCEQIVVSSVRDGSDGSVWIWAAVDNLTRGGATNAIEIARAAHPELLGG